MHDAEYGCGLEVSRESMHASVDAPERCSKTKWTKENVRRISITKNSTISEPFGSEFNVKSTNVKASVSRTKDRAYLKTLFHVQDNKISLKLFGSKRGVREEQERQEKIGYYVIHPCSIFR